jgi:tRNA(His) 5'-end guanylyltransferase
MNSKDTLGDRIKHYESISEHYFTPKVPILVRVDGKAFHTWTKGCDKPFDTKLINAMFISAKYVAKEMQNCKGLYVQSDEVTFVLDDSGSIETQQWFGGRQNKIESVTAALMTAYFNKTWTCLNWDNGRFNIGSYNPAVFDARAFQCPKEDVANVFLWRVKDWERNSISMFCLSHFSPKELHGQGRADQKEMLKKIGHSWEDECSDQQRNGSWWSPTKGDNYNLTDYLSINDFLFGAITSEEDLWLY